MINFACFSPHAPIFLPKIGKKEDLLAVKNTIENLEFLGKKLTEENPDRIIVSSPHQDWGFKVPLYFLAQNWQGQIQEVLIGSESPEFYFKRGKKFFADLDKNKKYALIASGDLSHCLLEDGPYGFCEDGPRFDESLIKCLKSKDIDKILNLDDDYPDASECGLRSFCFVLGILEAANINWRAKILSYEGPFGVGYLVVDLI